MSSCWMLSAIVPDWRRMHGKIYQMYIYAHAYACVLCDEFGYLKVLKVQRKYNIFFLDLFLNDIDNVREVLSQWDKHILMRDPYNYRLFEK